jgi:hypothetical protein
VPSTEGKRIQCVAGENACLPEDIGRPQAHFDFLVAIRDPTVLTAGVTSRAVC